MVGIGATGVFIVDVFSRVASKGLNLEEQSPAFIDIGESVFSPSKRRPLTPGA